MGLFSGLRDIGHSLLDGFEVLTVAKTAKSIFGGRGHTDEPGEKKPDAEKNSNMFGFGCEDELRYILSYWEKLPKAAKGAGISPMEAQISPKEFRQIVEVIGTLSERAQSKMVLILGLREKGEETSRENGKRETSGGANGQDKNKKPGDKKPTVITQEVIVTKVMRDADGAKCLEVFAYFLRNGGKPALIKFLRNGIISEPGKEIKEAIDAAEDVAGHILQTFGLGEEELEEVNMRLKEKILATRLRRRQKKAIKMGLT